MQKKCWSVYWVVAGKGTPPNASVCCVVFQIEACGQRIVCVSQILTVSGPAGDSDSHGGHAES